MLDMTSPYPPQPYAPPRAGNWRVMDWVLTTVVSALLLVGSGLVFYFSLFLAMATDSCFERCREEYIGYAWAVTWGGIAVALKLTLVGVTVGAVRRRLMVVWPLLGIAIVVVSVVVGANLADAAAGR
jgi:hypothetical protein